MNLKIKANLNKLNNHIKFIISALRCCEVCTFLSVWVRRVRRIQVPRMKGYKWSHTPECWWRQRLKGRGSGMMMTRSACRQYVENVRDWVQIYVHRLSTAGPAGGIWQQELLQVLGKERKKIRPRRLWCCHTRERDAKGLLPTFRWIPSARCPFSRIVILPSRVSKIKL